VESPLAGRNMHIEPAALMKVRQFHYPVPWSSKVRWPRRQPDHCQAAYAKTKTFCRFSGNRNDPLNFLSTRVLPEFGLSWWSTTESFISY
jgi:hypothetical protein